MLLQGRLFDYQIPGKAYEYAATDRPILTLGGPRGATTARMRYMTSSVTGDMDDPVSIGAALKKLVGLTPARRDITGMSRKERTVEFAQVLESFQLAGIR